MMGYNHATMSAGAGIVVLPLVHLPTAPQQVAWVVVCAGMGLLPDWDKAGSHVSRMWGWPSMAIANLIGSAAGGHRWGTHDLVLSPLAFGALFALAPLHPVTQLVALAVAFGLALRGLTAMGAGTLGAAGNAVASWGPAWLLVEHQQTALVSWLPLAVALGVVAHCLGDLATDEGLPVPIAWIWTRARFSLGLFSTNGLLERAIVTPALTLTVVWAVYRATGYASLGSIGGEAARWLLSLVPSVVTLVA